MDKVRPKTKINFFAQILAKFRNCCPKQKKFKFFLLPKNYKKLTFSIQKVPILLNTIKRISVTCPKTTEQLLKKFFFMRKPYEN